jgi:hypothetical protein
MAVEPAAPTVRVDGEATVLVIALTGSGRSSVRRGNGTWD